MSADHEAMMTNRRTRRLTARLVRRLSRFRDDESGMLTWFGLYLFLIMLIVAGVGVDLMLSEMKRTRLQNTLDRAILAAADTRQPLDPEGVVRDYFTKAGASEDLDKVVVDKGLTYRSVSAQANTTFNTLFMKLVGVKELSVPAAGTAEERIGGVEISMVLDVSGSMNSNSRLSNLKVAAKDFVDTLIENTEDGKLSISIVPYATQVSVPDELFNQLNTTSEHSFSNCINFQSTDFNSSSLSLTDQYQRTMHFDPWNDFDGRSYDPKRLVTRPVCEDDASRELMVLQKDGTKLKNYINNFWGGGNTSIDVGMKWGTALLDPSLEPAIGNLINTGDVSADFIERPYEYDSGRSLKVIVLMTDGQNTSQYYIHDDYRNGESNIWWNDQEEVYSVYVGLDTEDFDNDGNTEEPMFFWPKDNDWHDHAYGEGVYEDTVNERVCKSYKRNGSCKRYKTVKTVVTVEEPGTAEVVSYPELWARTSIRWNVRKHYEPWMYDNYAWDDWYYAVRKYVNSTVKNARTKAICDAAKSKGVIVFTIGFEAPNSGEAVLRDCASSPSHFFDVEGLEIRNAFSAIASAISQLKLTQ